MGLIRARAFIGTTGHLQCSYNNHDNDDTWWRRRFRLVGLAFGQPCRCPVRGSLQIWHIAHTLDIPIRLCRASLVARQARHPSTLLRTSQCCPLLVASQVLGRNSTVKFSGGHPYRASGHSQMEPEMLGCKDLNIREKFKISQSNTHYLGSCGRDAGS